MAAISSASIYSVPAFLEKALYESDLLIPANSQLEIQGICASEIWKLHCLDTSVVTVGLTQLINKMLAVVNKRIDDVRALSSCCFYVDVKRWSIGVINATDSSCSCKLNCANWNSTAKTWGAFFEKIGKGSLVMKSPEWCIITDLPKSLLDALELQLKLLSTHPPLQTKAVQEFLRTMDDPIESWGFALEARAERGVQYICVPNQNSLVIKPSLGTSLLWESKEGRAPETEAVTGFFSMKISLYELFISIAKLGRFDLPGAFELIITNLPPVLLILLTVEYEPLDILDYLFELCGFIADPECDKKRVEAHLDCSSRTLSILNKGIEPFVAKAYGDALALYQGEDAPFLIDVLTEGPLVCKTNQQLHFYLKRDDLSASELQRSLVKKKKSVDALDVLLSHFMPGLNCLLSESIDEVPKKKDVVGIVSSFQQGVEGVPGYHSLIKLAPPVGRALVLSLKEKS